MAYCNTDENPQLACIALYAVLPSKARMKLYRIHIAEAQVISVFVFGAVYRIWE